jgi:cell division protein FtsA
MLDGQIHDVSQVSAIIAQVRENLEEKAGCALDRAAIAAAGRALTTIRTEAELELPATREITDQDLHSLEILVLAKAREEMAREQDSLYCVGYSPVAYFLNGMKIVNPLGQRGSRIGVEIIATFLPQVVIDGLFSALSKAGLAVDSLTLEPIAAMAVAVPPHLRSLNLALVDIGAGTSDIAVSRQGTVIAYGMVDMAGDEITEAIAQHYLLDFNAAEAVKLALNGQDQVEFTDVLGNKYREDREKVMSVIEPAVEKLAQALAQAVKANNGGESPAALFCAGGGSLTPLLKDYLALHLELPSERIGIRTHAHLEGISFSGDELLGPEAITPLGIALTALKPQGEQFIRVWINGQGVTLFDVQKTTVAQALMHSGMDLDAVLGAGTGVIEFVLNGQTRSFMGKLGRAGVIRVNDVAATLDTELASGDRVEVTPGVASELPRISLGEIAAEFEPIAVQINDNIIQLPLIQRINGLPATGDTLIQPGDTIEIRPPATVGELATVMDLDLAQFEVEVDGAVAGPSTPFAPDSTIRLDAAPVKAASALDGSIAVTVNGEHHTLAPDKAILFYALAQAGIDQNDARGNLQITLNGVEADYTTPLKSGDRIEVFWAREQW